MLIAKNSKDKRQRPFSASLVPVKRYFYAGKKRFMVWAETRKKQRENVWSAVEIERQQSGRGRGDRMKRSEEEKVRLQELSSVIGWGVKVPCRGRGWLDQLPQHRVRYNEPISAGHSEKSRARQCQTNTTPRPMWTDKNQLGLDLCPERWKKTRTKYKFPLGKTKKTQRFMKGKGQRRAQVQKHCQLR